MKPKEIYKRVFKCNTELAALGYTLEQMENFWNDCYKKAKINKQLKLNLK